MSLPALAIVFLLVLGLNMSLARTALPRPAILGILLVTTIVSSQLLRLVL